MLNTVNTKPPHLVRGFFSVGSGPIKILIIGSCRVLPYVNYLNYLNTENRLTINLINVVNFYFDPLQRGFETEQTVATFEGNQELLEMIRGTRFYFHEHIERFGMFNNNRECGKHIYQFGMKPEHDVSLPNFNNIYIFFQSFVDLDAAVKNEVKREVDSMGKISPELQHKLRSRGLSDISHFLEICRKTSIPEFADLFERTWRNTRYFWTGSHIAMPFTREVFRLMNDRFLRLNIPQSFWTRVEQEDLYRDPHTPITQYDVDNYQLTWPQPVQPLKL